MAGEIPKYFLYFSDDFHSDNSLRQKNNILHTTTPTHRLIHSKEDTNTETKTECSSGLDKQTYKLTQISKHKNTQTPSLSSREGHVLKGFIGDYKTAEQPNTFRVSKCVPNTPLNT